MPVPFSCDMFKKVMFMVIYKFFICQLKVSHLKTNSHYCDFTQKF